jgi:type II secretory pathway pseudopilin PulG
VIQYQNNKTRPAPILRAWEDSPTIRIILAQRQKLVLGLTLVEMVIAMAIITIIFAAILPQFRIIQNSWDSQAGAAETLQNGRVLIEHLNRNLSTAVRVTSVSSSSETNGYIEFQDNDANNLRYDIGVNNYVEFGPIGSLSDLAGPVSKLQFSCYGAVDLSTPITDVNAIRSVKVETTLTNPAKLDQDMTFSTQAYIRTNALPASGGDILKLSEPWLEFDSLSGLEPALVHMSGTKYLCAYRGDNDNGFACTLTVNPADWSVSAAGFLEYDTKSGITPALARIDDNHALCAYQGFHGDGFACILFEKIPGMLQKGVPLEFDSSDCIYPVLSQIDTQGDTHHFLCAYAQISSTLVRALVLTATITDVLTDITSGPGISFASDTYAKPGLARIDETHYLCTYTGPGAGFYGRAVVLTVNTTDWTVTTETPCDFLTELVREPTLAKIDETHYLCVYRDFNFASYAIVLTVETSTWAVSKEPASSLFLETQTAGQHALCQIDNTNFLCAYSGQNYKGQAVVLTVDRGSWSLSQKPASQFDPVKCLSPSLCQIDVAHYLCAHSGSLDAGYAGVLGLAGGILP